MELITSREAEIDLILEFSPTERWAGINSHIATRFDEGISSIINYCTSIGAIHLKEPHSNTSVPCRLSLGMIDMVNSSTGDVTTSLVMPALPRLCAGLYSVPHCPVCLFTIRSTPFLCGAVNSVYVAAGSCIPASLIGVDVVNWV